MISSSRFKADGFVLVAVVWVLAAMALLVGFVASQLSTMQDQAISTQVKRIDDLNRLFIESTVLYLAATRGSSYGGLRTSPLSQQHVPTFDLFRIDAFRDRGDELRLDGRPYRVGGSYILRLQDAGSLVSLRNPNLNRLQALLFSYGLEPERTDTLIAALTDYTDRDETILLNGAERSFYLERQFIPPTNRYLSTPWQLHNVVEWSEFLDQAPAFFDDVTIYVADRENYNSMTPWAMEQVNGMSEIETKEIMSHRLTGSFGSLLEVMKVSGGITPRDPLAVTLVPSRYLRLILQKDEEGIEYWMGITLTPDSSLAPWEIDYRITRANTSGKEYVGSTPPTALLGKG